MAGVLDVRAEEGLRDLDMDAGAIAGLAVGVVCPDVIKQRREDTMVGSQMMLPMLVVASLIAADPAAAQKQYGPGVSDTEIKIGNTMPYSGPASGWGTLGHAHAAYFRMINEQGGVNGRKITYISLDDGYSPPKTVEQVRKLVEQEQVLLVFGALGTPSNTAIQQYMNDEKVPQLFVETGATKWGDPQHFPWTIGFQVTYQTEAKIYAKYLLQTKPDARIAILYQNDDYGKDYLKGIKDGLGDKAPTMIASEVSYEITDPTVDSQIFTLKGSGADVFFDITSPKFAAMAIRRAYDIGWHPLHFLNTGSSSIGGVLALAGLEKSVGLITAGAYKTPGDSQWIDDPAMKDYLAFMAKYYPGGDVTDGFNVAGYSVPQVLVQVLKQCGDNLTRENVMKQATNLDMTLGMLQPGIKVTTSPTDYYPIKQTRLAKFDGKSWVPFGEVLGF